MPRSGAATARDHAVLFYDRAPHAVDALATYALEGLSRGEAVVLAPTPGHADALRSALEAAGVDLRRAERDGRLALLDAATTLQTFVTDGVPDVARLGDGLGALISELATGGRPVRAAGEMVAVLWQEGNVTGALALEVAWNQLADDLGFGLLCPYPSSVLGSGSLAEVGRLCALHSEVVAPMAYTDGWDDATSSATTVFVPAPEAVGATRRLVAAVLADWSATRGVAVDELLVADACLVASEMAANAVTHAQSAFEVAVDCDEGAVRVTVSDIGPGAAERHPVGLLDLGGRGLTIVADVADRWGCDAVPGGKVVWAELSARQPVAH